MPLWAKSKYLLEREGFQVDDRWLQTRPETDAFLADQNVDTTPQTFLGGNRIGGYDDLKRYFGRSKSEGGLSYMPVIMLFAITALMSAAASVAIYGTPFSVRTIEWFVAFSMCALAMLKLQDVESFSTMFLNYDLLAKRWIPYSYIYPFAEGLAGVLMIAGVLKWLSVPIAFFIGSVGAVSVFYAVYVQHREIKCACVGGSSKVPLGFVSLTENIMMVAIALWTLGKVLY